MGDILKGKVAIVTGSGRGIGRAHAIAMAAQGARVVVNDPGVNLEGIGSDKGPADEVVAEIRKSGGEAVANYDSVATSKGAANIIKTAMDNFGRLDILVNNAGIFGLGTWIWDISDEEFDKMIKTHVYGHFYCAREAANIFRKQNSGRIINTSSTAGLGWHYTTAKDPRDTHYGTAKEALVGLTRTLAHEMENFGVTVNCIRPGATTRLARTFVTPKLAKQIGKEEAERRFAAMLQQSPPEACSALVVFLASDAASNVNGCIFYVEGGEVSIYRDPPYKAGTVWKDGIWTLEELMQLLPKTITAGKGS